MAKMTDAEFNKALDEIIDRFTDAVLEVTKESNDLIGKIMLEEFADVEIDKVQQEFDLRLKEIKQLFYERVKNLMTIERLKQ
jgi:hypothetical protein